MPRHNHPKKGPRRSHFPSQKQPEHESSLPEPLLTDPHYVHLDGCTLEGGGQLVRLALTLSALISIPIHIHHIRGGRGGGGGLKSSHLAALNFLAECTAAKTWGAGLGSSEILFEPGRDRQVLKARESGAGLVLDGDKPYEIKLSSPGSVWLILQCLLPWILFASPSTTSSQPVRLTLHGGTNVSKSMSGEYVQSVLLPTLQNIGLPRITVEIEKRGWSTGKTTSIGVVHISIPPLPHGTLLKPFNLKQRGTITETELTVIAEPLELREALIAQTESALTSHPDLPAPNISVNESSGDPRRIYLLLVAHSGGTGDRLGRDMLWEGKLKTPLNDAQIEVVATRMARRVVGDVVGELGHGRGRDEFLEDQLVVFEALAGKKRGEEEKELSEGKNKAEGEEETLHTKTCRWVVEQILGRENGVEGVTEGIGFAAGEVYRDRAEKSDLSAEMGKLDVKSEQDDDER